MFNFLKLTIITGPIGSGKSQLAFKLKNDLDIFYGRKKVVLLDIAYPLKERANEFLKIHPTEAADKDTPKSIWNNLSYRQILFNISDVQKKIYGEDVFVKSYINLLISHLNNGRNNIITTGILNTDELRSIFQHLIKVDPTVKIILTHWEFAFPTNPKIKPIHDIRSKVLSEVIPIEFPINIIGYEKIQVGEDE